MDNGDEESSDTTSQNESEVGSQSGSSQFDNQNLDDKVYFGFFENVKATTSEVTLMAENSISGSIPVFSNGLAIESTENDENDASTDSDASGGAPFKHVFVVFQ